LRGAASAKEVKARTAETRAVVNFIVNDVEILKYRV
jgi:hypothetical protein